MIVVINFSKKVLTYNINSVKINYKLKLRGRNMRVTKSRERKVLTFCQKNYGDNLNVFFHHTDFYIYKNGEFIAQIFYSDIGA
jgi:hypothetical protein